MNWTKAVSQVRKFILQKYSTLSKIPSVIPQSENKPSTWSRSQIPKQVAMSGPSFEQTDFQVQPNPPSAMEFISKVPVTFVESRVASCDGGGGALGHPKVYINLDQGHAMSCGYCGLRFQQKKHH